MSKYERLARLMKITTLIKAKKNIHRQDLADRCEVSIRTIQRDIDTLCYAGIPIYRSGNGYEIMPGFFMPPVNLSLSEVLNLIIAARYSSGKVEENCQRAIESALSKIIAALPAETQSKLEDALEGLEYDSDEILETNDSYLELVEA